MRHNLKLAIVRSGKTQRAIAHALRVPESRLSAIVRGWTDPRPNERIALAAVLEEPVAALFEEEVRLDARTDRGSRGAA